MTGLPSQDLELKAADDRRRLHEVVAELRSRVHEDLDVKKRVRAHLRATSIVAGLLSLGLGYAVTGLFVRH